MGMTHACRDIKSANIMRPDSSRVKIGDLGVAKVLKGAMTKTQIGTPHYMPPEVRPPGIRVHSPTVLAAFVMHAQFHITGLLFNATRHQDACCDTIHNLRAGHGIKSVEYGGELPAGKVKTDDRSGPS